MKKLLLSTLLALFCISAFCAEAEESAEKTEQSAEAASKDEKKQAEKAAKEAAKEKATERTDSFLGVKYHTTDYYDFKKKFLRVELLGPKGNFNIFAQGDERETALLSLSDSFASSSFYVRIDKRDYRLNESNNIKREIRRLDKDSGAQLVYTVAKTVQVVVDFSLFPSREKYDEDIVRITAHVLNISGKKHKISLKLLLDTSCGEASDYHFTTAANTKIANECQFSAEEIKTERCVIVSDDETTFQILLDGPEISPVSSVTLGNVDALRKMTGTLNSVKGRSFTNMRAYGDSAVLIAWDTFTLIPSESQKISFLIAAATDGDEALGLHYIDGLEMPEDKKTSEDEATPAQPADSTLAEEQNPDKRTDVDFVVPPIKDYQLDPEYIQRLIDRIDSLQSSDNVNPVEVSHLNAELDAILEKLRQQ